MTAASVLAVTLAGCCGGAKVRQGASYAGALSRPETIGSAGRGVKSTSDNCVGMEQPLRPG